MVRISGQEGIFTALMVRRSPPPPPQPVHSQRDTMCIEVFERDVRRTILLRSMAEETRALSAQAVVMQNTIWGYIESRLSSPMRDGGSPGRVLQEDGSANR